MSNNYVKTLDENMNKELWKIEDWMKINKLSINYNRAKLEGFISPEN